MRYDRRDIQEIVDQALSAYRDPSEEDIRSAIDGVRHNLRPTVERLQQHTLVDVELPQRTFKNGLLFRLGIASVVVVSLFFGFVLARNFVAGKNTYAIVQQTGAEIYRIDGDRNQLLPAGARVPAGQLIRSFGSGAVVVLADGSHVEMRAQSELAMADAPDGLRILLNKGSVIVTASKQHSGHLYLQTKDMTVSVVGTVFVVNAEEEGSRVAVIEGEVRMRQGAAEMKLLPGEQVATSPLMESLGVKEELSWSRHAEEHLALLQSKVPPPAQPMESRDVFELASVRPLGLPSGGSAAAGTGPTGCHDGGWIGAIQMNPGRIVIPAITLAALVNMAYKQDCFLAEGGPEWVRSDRFNIEAIIPAGSPLYTWRDLIEGKAPKLQNMLQNLLLDRFKLVVRREMKEMSIYTLVVVKDGKMKSSEDQTPPDFSIRSIPRRGDAVRRGSMSLVANASGEVTYSASAVPVWELTKILQGQLARPVFDRTELKGLFDIRLQFAAEPSGVQTAPQAATPAGPLLSTAIQDQLGLKLVSARAPVEVLIIERAERPSEN